MTRLAASIDGPVIVIGDLHGQADQFTQLLSHLKRLRDFDQRWIVLLGDLMDRGPDAKGVVDSVLELIDSHPRTTVVCGNHELAMSRALGWIPAQQEPGTGWLHGYGAEKTFASYGVPFPDVEEFQRRVPTSHRQLIAGLPWCVEHPQYLFVHAGLDPDLNCEVQLSVLRQRAQTGGRIPWLCSKRLAHADPPGDCRKCVVSGHALVRDIVFRKRRILAGTSDGIQGEVSAVLLPERLAITVAEIARKAA